MKSHIIANGVDVLINQAEKISTDKPWQTTSPRDLNEQILWKSVLQKPQAGAPLSLGGDPRFPKEAGFQKMQANHSLPNESNISFRPATWSNH